MAWTLIAAALVVLCWAPAATAHPLAPVGLELRAEGQGRVQLRMKRALVLPRGARLRPVWPEGCVARGAPEIATSDDAVVETIALRCEGPLSGARFGIAGLADSGLDAVVRIERGEATQRVVLHGEDQLVIPGQPSSWRVFRGHLALGMEHMIGGLDHLLFVIALWLMVRGRRLVIALTAFTVGHSLTLAAATLGWVGVPAAVIELSIALSLLVMAVRAVEVLGGEADPPGPAIGLVTGAFGLLHGLGFARALTEAGLPAGEEPLALFGFNLGVEIAQLAVVAAAGLSVAAIGRAKVRAGDRWVRIAGAGRVVPAYALGAVAAMWCLERAWIALA